MAKNRNKKKNSQKKNGPVSMDISAENSIDAPQAMDTTEGKPSNPALGATDRLTACCKIYSSDGHFIRTEVQRSLCHLPRLLAKRASSHSHTKFTILRCC
ncbi:uncharacterized protein [Elaeis guineensis]|uniref:uncharacterized protein isoform X3 n=1 Tax=Elaeis guineensis var. tenera TaxID=51953 RepID=UPI003C6CD102